MKPYSLTRVLRGFGDCTTSGKRRHPAIDIAGVGKHSGLGDPIVAMTRSRISFIGTPESSAKKFGRRDLRSGSVTRGRKRLPRSLAIKGYGRVYFFTRTYGSWKSGVVIVTKALDGPLAGHTIRYMHLAAVHPSLRPGSIVQPGQEIGLMGSTAIMDSTPHVHIDITGPDGERIDVAPLLGLPPTDLPCP